MKIADDLTEVLPSLSICQILFWCTYHHVKLLSIVCIMWNGAKLRPDEGGLMFALFLCSKLLLTEIRRHTYSSIGFLCKFKRFLEQRKTWKKLAEIVVQFWAGNTRNLLISLIRFRVSLWNLIYADWEFENGNSLKSWVWHAYARTHAHKHTLQVIRGTNFEPLIKTYTECVTDLD